MNSQNDDSALHSLISLKLNVVQAKISRQVGQAVQRLANLRLPEWRILALVARSGPMSQADIRSRIGMDKGQISRTVKAMLGSHLLVADNTSGQSRNVLLSVSDIGREKHDHVHSMMETRNEQLMAGLDSDEQANLYRGLTRIEAMVDSLSSESIQVDEMNHGQPAVATVEYAAEVK